MTSLRRLPTALVAVAAALAAACGDSSVHTGGSSNAPDAGEPFSQLCQVTFSGQAPGPEPLVEVEVGPWINYDSTLGTFAVDEGTPRCRTRYDDLYMVDQVTCATGFDLCNLYFVLDDRDGIELPGELATCAFLANAAVTPSDFELGLWLHVQEWEPVPGDYSYPKLTVSSVSCLPLDEVTTTTSSTTTMPPACADSDCAEGNRCLGGQCRAVEAGQIEIMLEFTAGPVHALQLEVDYDHSDLRLAHGGGPGACAANRSLDAFFVDCNFEAPGDCELGATFHDHELQLAIISLAGLTAPVRLATCEVYAENLEEAVRALFVNLIDRNNGDEEQVPVRISASLLR